MAEFKIDAKHPSWEKYQPKWETMRDCLDGEDAVKARDKETSQKYLPMKSGTRNLSTEDQKVVYGAYKQRAEFPDICAPTVRGLAGLIGSSDPEIELPEAMEPLRKKATKDGLTLVDFYETIVSEVLRVGRFGIFPGVDDDGELYLTGYATETIINWDDDDGELSYTVLDETAQKRDPETNEWGMVSQYRENKLEMSDTGTATFISTVWIEVKNEKGEKIFVPTEPEFATKRGGEALDFMPFQFVDSMDLTPEPAEIPLYGLGKLALRGYRLDADYSNSLHMVSEPTPWVSGVSADQAPSEIGASTLWVLEGADAKAGMLEFSGPGISEQAKAIQSTLERAIVFGANLFSDNNKTAESGEALKIRLGNQSSILINISKNAASALERVLKMGAIWIGADPEQVKVKANDEFVKKVLTPQELTALVGSWQSGAYSKLTLFENLRTGGIIDPEREFEDEEELIGEEGDGTGNIPPAGDDELPGEEDEEEAQGGALSNVLAGLKEALTGGRSNGEDER